ncbi:MAG: thermonuclease family protein [Chloroflexota bacterium]
MTRRGRRAAERSARSRAKKSRVDADVKSAQNRRRFTYVVLALIIAAVFIVVRGLGGFGIPTSVPAETLVERVIDGDTIDMADGSRVRYLCIDTPERGEQFYQEATDFNRDLVDGRAVELERGLRDVDQYGRLLRYVHVGDVFVNAELVSAGLARTLIFDDNEKHAALLRRLEAEAQAADRGLWALE